MSTPVVFSSNLGASPFTLSRGLSPPTANLKPSGWSPCRSVLRHLLIFSLRDNIHNFSGFLVARFLNQLGFPSIFSRRIPDGQTSTFSCSQSTTNIHYRHKQDLKKMD